MLNGKLIMYFTVIMVLSSIHQISFFRCTMCVLWATVMFHSGLRTLTMQRLTSTKPGLQNLQLWAANTDEKQKNMNVISTRLYAYLNPPVSLYALNWVHYHLVYYFDLLCLVLSSVEVLFLPQTLLWVQLQLHYWAPVHTQTGSQTTACGCRRSCCRERASSRDRHHWRTFPPVENNK